MEGFYKIKPTQETISKRQPRDEQRDAFREMSKVFTFPIDSYKGTMISLPTGGGKTYTAIKWLCDNILPKNIKILWLAQSTYLLDQALSTFLSEARYTANRETINIRIISSNNHHANAGTVDLSDDIIICTTQTAVLNYNSTSLDLSGTPTKKPLGKFIDAYIDGSLFIVIDEAHHTPAYGCRNMLLNISNNLTNSLYILGLTATPYHNDKRISGWLQKIYNCGTNGVSYIVSEKELQFKNVLAVPKYIQKETNISVNIDDSTYNRLQHEHKDLPDSIIDMLAANNTRNNLIANDYIQNKSVYGKTIIFADRWVQCESIVSKLTQNGIKADAIYSKIESGIPSNDVNGRTRNELNKAAMDKFRNNELDVIVNVKMLTEGVDVPDVKTVMLTRQTTSPILFTQMVGRALRGKEAGGGTDKTEANIVLFVDNWERFIDFRHKIGNAEFVPSAEVYTRITDLISIELVKRACADLPFDELLASPSYMSLIPLGWYQIEYTLFVQNDNNEELVTVKEAIPAYNVNKSCFEDFLNNVSYNDFPECEDESVSDEIMLGYAEKYAKMYFKNANGIDNNLKNYISSLIKHIAQNRRKPDFISFNERNLYDLSAIAKDCIASETSDSNIIKMCQDLYNDETKLWKNFYNNWQTLYLAIRREKDIILLSASADDEPVEASTIQPPDIDTEQLRQDTFIRDNFTCQCCGKQRGRGVKLEADHIKPVNMGGRTVVDNMQTLCKECNLAKNTDTINFGITKTPLSSPLPIRFFRMVQSDDIENYLARVINFIYHCKAFKTLKYSKRSNGEYYREWLISLYPGNDPAFIAQYETEIIDCLHKLGYTHCIKIRVE